MRKERDKSLQELLLEHIMNPLLAIKAQSAPKKVLSPQASSVQDKKSKKGQT